MLYNHLSSHIGHIGPCHFAPLVTLLRKQNIGYITGVSNSLYKGAFTPSSPPGRRYRSGWLSVNLAIYLTHLIAKMPSASGRHGLSTILHTRDEPRPLRKDSRVVDACALLVSYGTTRLAYMMFPPLWIVSYVRSPPSCTYIGFFASATANCPPSTCATTWFVTTTATPNCRQLSLQLQVSSPRPPGASVFGGTWRGAFAGQPALHVH